MIKHPYYEYNSDHALKLARSIKYGPIPKEEDPTPSAKDALSLIENSRKDCGFNWITGRVASEVLRAELGHENPFTT